MGGGYMLKNLLLAGVHDQRSVETTALESYLEPSLMLLT